MQTEQVTVCLACGEEVCKKPGICLLALDNIDDMERQDREIAEYEYAMERAAEWKLDRGNF